MFLRLSTFYFFYFAAVAVYIIFMPKVLSNVGYTPFEIGVLFAAAPLSRFLSPFLFATFFQLTRRTFDLALWGSVLSGILILSVIEVFWPLLIAYVLMGFFWSLMLPFVEVMALEYIGKERYGRSRLYGSIGFTVMALGLGQSELEFALSMGLYLGTIMITALCGVALRSGVIVPPRRKRVVFTTQHQWGIWIGLFLVQVGFGSFYNFFTIFELEQGLSLDIITYLWAFGVIAEIGMFLIQHRIMHFDIIQLMRFAVFITAFRWLMVHFWPDTLWVLTLSQGLHAFSLALLHTVSIAWINHCYQNRQLAQQFYLGITFGLGMFIGSLISGIFYGKNLFLYSALITLLAWGFTLRPTLFSRGSS